MSQTMLSMDGCGLMSVHWSRDCFHVRVRINPWITAEPSAADLKGRVPSHEEGLHILKK